MLVILVHEQIQLVVFGFFGVHVIIVFCIGWHLWDRLGGLLWVPSACRTWSILARREKLSVKLIDKYKDDNKDICLKHSNIMAWLDQEIK